VLVITGLLVYIAAFWGYAGVNEMTTFAMIMTFLMIRFIAEALIVSPNNLATLDALPENKVYMATALSGLLRSIANTMGTAIAAVVWDQRYNRHILQYVEDNPLDTLGFAGALHSWQQTLQWAGESAMELSNQTMGLLHDRLLAEASTAAWQDYFLFNAMVAGLAILPALPFWRRKKYQPSAASQTAAVPAHSTTADDGVSTSQKAPRDNPTRSTP
jgi:hypothetical protein